MTEESRIRNICAEMMHDYKESIRVIGCPTDKGCFKGREIENYIKGPMTSHINDLKTGQEKQDEINQETHKKMGAVMAMVKDAVEATAKAAIASEKATTAAEGAKKALDKVWLAILLPILGSAIVFFASQWFLISPKQDLMIKALQAKLTQDSDNQKETVEYLKVLATRLKEEKNAKFH